MKKIFILLFLCIFCDTFCRPLNKKDIEYLSAFGKVWGFLKYYHPEVAKGKFNWDTVAVMNYERILAVRSKNEFNSLMHGIIESAGKIRICKNCKTMFPVNAYRKPDFSWMNDTSIFNPALSEKLQWILNNYKPGDHYYIKRKANVGNPDFGNEEHYDVSLPSKEYRFLALCRFWNIINYYYPYISEISFPWDSLFIEFIPRMANIPTDYSYFRTIQEMASRLNDGHAFVTSRLANMFENRRLLPFRIKDFENKNIVSSYIDSSICLENDIKTGDIITEIDGFNSGLLRKHHARYIASSNNTYLNGRVNNWMSAVKTDTSEIKILRGNDTIALKVKTLPTPYIVKRNPMEKPSWFLINDSVGYIHLGKIKSPEIDNMFASFQNTKFIIADGRYYPNWTVHYLAEKFLPERTVIARITEPDYHYPGFIDWVEPMYAGKTNKSFYKGKLILLVNDETMSQGEITMMMFMKAPDYITIGTQTAGACGDVSSIPIPGGIDINFSGLGYYFSDFSPLQKKGIQPIIQVQPTLDDIKNGKDAILERALEYVGERE